jgi:hypothetical protein
MSKMKGKLQTLLCIGGRSWQLSRKVIPAHPRRTSKFFMKTLPDDRLGGRIPDEDSDWA